MVTKPLRISDDILPIGEAKAQLSSIVRGLGERGRPVVITQHGRPACVLLTPDEYDRLTYRDRVRAAVEEGLASIEAGAGYTTEEVRAILARDLEESADD